MRRALAVLAAVAGALLLLAGPASAHDVLEGSDPANGASVATSPARVTLTFNESVQPDFTTVTVVGPDGGHYEQGQATVEAERVSTGVGRLGPAGRYEIGYRIVSADGHPVSGSTSFTLTSAQGGTASAGSAGSSAPAAPQASPAASAEPIAEDASSGPPAWIFVAVAVVVVGGALALVLRRRA